MGSQKFNDLIVWKKSLELTIEIFRQFKDSRDFGFKDQITRSALSITSNIAEGYERESNKEFIRFFNYFKSFLWRTQDTASGCKRNWIFRKSISRKIN